MPHCHVHEHHARVGDRVHGVGGGEPKVPQGRGVRRVQGWRVPDGSSVGVARVRWARQSGEAVCVTKGQTHVKANASRGGGGWLRGVHLLPPPGAYKPQPSLSSPPQPCQALRDTLCSCEACGMRPKQGANATNATRWEQRQQRSSDEKGRRTTYWKMSFSTSPAAMPNTTTRVRRWARPESTNQNWEHVEGGGGEECAVR